MSTIIPIDDPNDPRIAVFASLKDRELARDGERFIAEGEHVVRRLIASAFPVESVLLSTRRVEQIAPDVPEGVPVYVATDELLKSTIGYRFHSGIIACGRRIAGPTLDQIAGDTTRPLSLVILPDLNNTENLGLIIRIAAAFGADAMVLGENSCDPFYRQAVRVSMGTVFSMPMVRSSDIKQDLSRLRDAFKVELLATVLDADASPLRTARRSKRWGVLFGGEAHGLSPDIVALCNQKLTIPMRKGTDSLNVAVAAGIFMHHLVESAGA